MKISFPERTSTFSKKIGFDGFSRMVRVDLPYEHQDSIVTLVRFGLCEPSWTYQISQLETRHALAHYSPFSNLNAEQKPLYDDMRHGIAANFQGFVNVRDDGALLGPWNPWIHEPKFGKPVWELTKAMVSKPSLPAAVREVAILVTGAHFRSGYELYAHVIVAEHRGLSDEKLSTIVAGQRPTDLSRQEAVAYDFASALVSGGVLPELTYRAAIEQFGKHGAAELSYLVGFYCLVSVTLNTFDVPIPD
jgi:4-carboxymuconolactone decarboxylase